MSDEIPTPWLSAETIRHAQRLLDSYRHWTGKDLIPRSEDAETDARALFHAPFVVASHGSEGDPLLDYGNAQALALWESEWEQFIGMPSRLTAEAPERDERQQMLRRSLEEGFIEDYSGIRISTRGRRFVIDNALVWRILDDGGKPVGQAATFSDWKFVADWDA